jgi:hypothetical protein
MYTLASIVLPVPGGPISSMPLQHRANSNRVSYVVADSHSELSSTAYDSTSYKTTAR